jgi:FkbM family methyltransferase
MKPHSRRVIAIEPNPDLATRLKWLCYLSMQTSISVRNIALSDRDGVLTLRIPLGEHGRATIESANPLLGRKTREVRVRTRRLDDLPIADVGFIKIDVEGHELAVLRGAERLLRESRPNLLIEANAEHRPNAVPSICEYLAPLGYRGWFLNSGELTDIRSFDASAHNAENFIFRPEAACAEGSSITSG